MHKVESGLRRVKHRLQTSGGMSQPGAALPCRFNVDTPTRPVVADPKLIVEGWIVPDEGMELQAMRATLNEQSVEVQIGQKRADVARVFPGRTGAESSGFSVELQSQTGRLNVEVDFGRGFQLLYHLDVRFAPERLVADLLNPNLANNMAEHLNLLANQKAYYFEDAATANYQRAADDPRLVAFYFPQFQPVPENDRVWGKGFTEWTNASAATPRFVGHQQPYLPRDLGFYDLRLDQTLEDQIRLAKQYGIYGFCFYYYWFSGHRVMEGPLEKLVEHKDWDFNFMICWANENWTKRWTGRSDEVTVAQEYRDEDPLKFIQDVEAILNDPRYITTEDGKPILVLHRASDLREPERYVKIWRDYFRKKYHKELELVASLTFDADDPRSYGFDKALDFAPQSAFFKGDSFSDGYPNLNVSDRLLDPYFEGQVADYRRVALNERLNTYFDFPIYACVTPSWDNDARKKGKGFVMQRNNPDIYGAWLERVLRTETADGQKSPLVFLNAWNEWAEGAVLEPSQHFGSAVLRRTAERLALFSHDRHNLQQFPLYGLRRAKDVELAVVLHIYYPERWEIMKERLKLLGTLPHDLVVTITEKDRDLAGTIREFNPKAQIIVVPNRGRDVLPFMHVARRLQAAGYKYVLKLHSKKSLHRTDGNEWFEDVLSRLIPSAKVARQVMAALQGQQAALIGPAGHVVSVKRHMGANQEALNRLIESSTGQAAPAPDELYRYGFLGGTMFWASLASLAPLLDLYFMPEDFESEQGQIDGTLAHAMERALSIVPQLRGQELYVVSEAGVKPAGPVDPDEKYTYAP